MRIDVYLVEKGFLATVESWDPENSRATLIQKNKMFDNSEVECLTPGKTGVPFKATEMQNENGEPIESAPHPMMRFSVKSPFELKPGDIIRMK